MTPRSDRGEEIQSPNEPAPVSKSKGFGGQPVTPQPETQPPVRPSSEKKTIPQSRQRLDQLLKDFQTAYEAQDFESLHRLSDIGTDRQTFLEMMANNYSRISVSIQNLSVKEDQATATLIHEELIDKNGEQVDPNPILRKIRIAVRKEGDHWSKVMW
jgi:hypothetical protein